METPDLSFSLWLEASDWHSFRRERGYKDVGHMIHGKTGWKPESRVDNPRIDDVQDLKMYHDRLVDTQDVNIKDFRNFLIEFIRFLPLSESELSGEYALRRRIENLWYSLYAYVQFPGTFIKDIERALWFTTSIVRMMEEKRDKYSISDTARRETISYIKTMLPLIKNLMSLIKDYYSDEAKLQRRNRMRLKAYERNQSWLNEPQQ